MSAGSASITPNAIAVDAPIAVEQVVLGARDAARLRAFYVDLIGLDVIGEAAQSVALGVDGRVLIRLEATPDAAPDDPRSAGLFHLAILLADRGVLAQWLRRSAGAGLRVDGASDHGVSEAIYVTDPEGNGVEIYADRAPQDWPRGAGDALAMSTDPLDIDGLMAAEADAPNPLAGARLGHVHLRVGDVDAARRFYADGLGMSRTQDYPGAAFFASGDYHHHIAGNVWRSSGAGARAEAQAGLLETVLSTRDASVMAAARTGLEAIGAPLRETPNGFEARDPWGLRLRLTPREAG